MPLCHLLLSCFTLRSLVVVVGVFTFLGAWDFVAELKSASDRFGFVGSSSFASPSRPNYLSTPSDLSAQTRPSIDQPGSTAAEAVSCIGPRGRRIAESADDQIRTHRIGAYPPTFAGSYSALGLDELWTSAEERYGPYGYHEIHNEGPREPVNWPGVDWGQLQAQCQADNQHRFPESAQAPFKPWKRGLRLRTKEDTNRQWDRLGDRTGRTLLVLRAYDGYTYTDEDLINLRSLISEAGLQSGGEYSVLLFVNIRKSQGSFLRRSRGIYESDESYDRAFYDARIPEELQSIAMLWDEHLLQSWYPNIGKHSIEHQINQSLQLLALFYPEFDHFWQLELDFRSLGHFVPLLQAVHNFTTQEPRKQSFERASYMHFPARHGSYEDFLGLVNNSMAGGATIWGPVSIPEISEPIGPVPLTRPEEDNFEWGVGEDADVVVTSPCSWVFRMPHWAWRSLYKGLSLRDETPRLACPPAIQRASRRLLLAVHAGQEKGIAIASESTLPSFALWHGLKLSFPPLPYFQRKPPADLRTSEVFFNGGAPGERVRLASPLPKNHAAATKQIKHDVAAWWAGTLKDDRPIAEEWRRNGTDPVTIPLLDKPWREWYRGFAAGEQATDQGPREELVLGLSWWWSSSFPRRILDVWTGGTFADGIATHDAEAEQAKIDKTRKKGDIAEAQRLEDLRRQDEEFEASQVLRRHNGKWYAPALWLHPAKTVRNKR